ncbi:MAG TPA: MarR family winged helix-turn-helix transcriptional regulator [Solirubrobacteraceae bacterium]|nr:MarR family winged helix-turn-helix transcriptional regulator [Solirubrobacteraceae bacterium]
MQTAPTLTQEEYRRLAQLRHGQRQFLHWSAEQARRVGLTSTQHQLLLGIRAHEDPAGPTISQIAEFLLIRHHSAVELVDRAQAAGLTERRRHAEHLSQVHVTLTPLGEDKLRALTEIHLRELAQLAPTMSALWSAVAQAAAAAPGAAR